MSLLRTTPLLITSLLASFAFVACEGGEGDGTPDEAATPTPASPHVATVTPTAVVLQDYLVATLGIEADFGRITADFREALPESQEDATHTKQAIVELESALSPFVDEAMETLSRVAPPPEAEAYQDALVSVFGDLDTFAGNVAAALEPGSAIVLDPVIGDFTDLAIRLSDAALQGQTLVVSALESAAEDPVSTYLVAATEQRAEFSRALAEPSDELDRLLAAGDTSGVLAVLEKLIASLEGLRDQWQQISPPAEAEDLHQRYGELIDEAIAVQRLIHTALSDDDQSVLATAADRSKQTSILRDRLDADWDEMLIKVLSR